MKLLKSLFKNEDGQVLPMALILLVLGSLLVVPALSLMSTNLITNRQVDQSNLELYAADAGVENILWNIQKDPNTLPAEGTPKTINLQDQAINNMTAVITTITNVGDRNYRINSIATSPNGQTTEVETFLHNVNFSNLLEGAITSNGDLNISNSTINGDVFFADDQHVTHTNFTDPPQQKTQTNWPTWDDLSPMYLKDVQGHTYTGPNPLYINTLNPCDLGPIYDNGSLIVDSNTKDLTLKLTGTLYVTGNLIFRQSKNYTIDLNKQTMFVYGTPATHNPDSNTDWAIDFPSNSVTVKGSGCIIADGNINFMPGMSSNPDEYVLVMSLSGKTNMKPGGPFFGSLVGNAEVDLANNNLTWTDPYGRGLNFPGLLIGSTTTDNGAGTVLSYKIISGN